MKKSGLAVVPMMGHGKRDSCRWRFSCPIVGQVCVDGRWAEPLQEWEQRSQYHVMAPCILSVRQGGWTAVQTSKPIAYTNIHSMLAYTYVAGYRYLRTYLDQYIRMYNAVTMRK